MKVKARGSTQTWTTGPLLTKKTTQNGNKGQEGENYIHSSTQQDTGEKQKESYLPTEGERKEVKIKKLPEKRLKIKQELN